MWYLSQFFSSCYNLGIAFKRKYHCFVLYLIFSSYWYSWIYVLLVYLKSEVTRIGCFIPELLRVMRRLSMKEQWTDVSLQYLTLSTLQSALSENPRAQNHFRSIGGLEVLLDGLGYSSTNALALKNNFSADKER